MRCEKNNLVTLLKYSSMLNVIYYINCQSDYFINKRKQHKLYEE